jgi:MFS transporter, DHA1 family, inner membrane transport protein
VILRPATSPWARIGGAALAVGLLYVAMFAVPPLITTFVDDLGLSHSQAGALMSITLGAFLVSSLFSGRLVDRVGASRVIVAGLALCGAASLCFALTDIYPVFLLCRAALGLAGGLIYAPGIAYVAALLPFSRANFGIGVYLTGLAAGSAVAFFVTKPLAEWLGWRWPFVLFGLSALVGMVVFGILSGAWASPSKARGESRQESPVRRVLASPPFRLLLVALGASMFVAYGVFTWVAPYLDESAGFSTAEVSFAAGVMTLAGIPGTFWAGWLSDRTGRPLSVAAGGMAFGLLLAAFAATSNPSFPAAIAIASLATFGVSLGLTPLFSLPPLLFEPSAAGTASGLATSAGMAGGVASTYAGGWIVGTSDYAAAFTVYSGIALVTVAGIIPLTGVSLRRWRAAGSG